MTKFNFKRSALGVFFTNFNRDSHDFLKQFKKKNYLAKKNVQKKWHYFSLAWKIKSTNLGTRIKPGQRRLTQARERLIPKLILNFPALPQISISLPSQQTGYAVLKVAAFCFLLFVLGAPVFEKVFSPSNWVYRQTQKQEILSPLSNAYIKSSQYSYTKKLDLSYLAEVIPTATPTPVPTVVTPETTLAPTIPVGTGGSPEVLSASDTADLSTLLPSDTVSETASESGVVATESANLSPIPTVEMIPIETVTPTAVEPASLPVPTIVSDWNLPIVRIPKITKRNLSAREDLEISLDGYSPDIFTAEVTDSEGKKVKVETENRDGKIIVRQPSEFRPGKYRISLMVGNTTLMTQDFTWGVLAINTNKSIYLSAEARAKVDLPDEKANLSFAVLDEQGRMVCNAKLELRITNKELRIDEILSTENGTIKVNPECQSHNFTLNPDYEAEYLVGEAGQYDLELTAETQNGTYTINDSFEVRDSVAFDVERNSATRIYPPVQYPFYFYIIADEDFEGVIEEVVPADFDIFPVDKTRAFDKVETNGLVKIISWNVSLKKGEKVSLGYQYKAPDISPQFYLLGPLTIKQLNNETIFSESRRWQIAADADVVYTASGNFVAPANVYAVYVEAWGAGGGGGVIVASGGGGGGGGAYAAGKVSVVPGNTYAYVVGVGGVADSGSAGGDSSFNSTSIVAKGGAGTSGVLGALGGGTGATGTVNFKGGDGKAGHTTGDNGGGGGGAGGPNGAGVDGVAAVSGATKGGDGGAGNAGTANGGGAGGLGVTADNGQAGGSAEVGGGGGGGGANGKYGGVGGAPGGGGGGGEITGGQTGGRGQIRLTYDYAPTVALNTPADTATGQSSTPTLNFTGTDLNADTLEYNVQVDTVNTFGTPPVYDNKTTAVQNSGTTITFSHTTTTNNDRIIVVGLAYRAATNPTAAVSSITYGGDALTYINRASAVDRKTELWYLKAPKTGANNVVVTMSLDPEDLTVGAITYSGVNQTTPIRNNSTNTGESASQSVVVASETDEIVFGISSIYPNGTSNPVTTTTTGGEIERWSVATANNNIRGSGADKPGEVSTTVSWTSSQSFTWAASGVGIVGKVILIKKFSTTDAGFTAGHPFASGTAIDYTVQAGDALTAGATYYWRVRAIDLLGSNAYGAWSATRSFTVAPKITVSGIIYSDEGSTAYNCTSTNLTVKAVVNGTGVGSSGVCSASGGSFLIENISVGNTGDIITLYLDGENEKATTVTKLLDTSSGVTAPLYQNRILLDHKDSGPITNTDLDKYDSGNDSDIQFTVTGGVLTVNAGSKISIVSGKTYTPGNNVTAPAIGVGGTFNPGSNTISLNAMGTNTTCTGAAGTVIPFCINSGTFNSATSTINFIGIGASTAILPATSYYNLGVGTSSETGTGATFTLGGNVNVGGTFTVGNTGSTNIDTLNGSSYTLTLSQEGTPLNITSKGAFAPATSTVNYIAPIATTLGATSYYNLGVGTSAEAGTGATFTLGGNVSVGGTFTVGNASSTNVDRLDNETGDKTMDINGDLLITSKGALSFSSSATTTIARGFTNNGTFAAGTGTITFDGVGYTSPIYYGGTGSTQPFYNLFITTPGKTMQFDETEMTGVGGSFYVQGSDCTSNRVFLDSTTDVDKWDVKVTGSTDVDYANIKDSNAITALTANNSTGTNYTNWTVNAGACGGANQNPNSPANLGQAKTDNTTITAGTWVNTTSIKIGATVSDQDASDTIYLCAEAVGIGTSFTNTETLCGDAVSYSGTALPASVTLTLSNNTEYHWQVRVKDTGGLYSSWVAFGGGVTRDFGIDTSAPTGGTVYDGLDSGVDKSFNDGSLTQLSGNWSGIDAQVSGLYYYEYGIGTTAGTTDVKAWTNVGAGVTATATGLSLQTSQTYFFNVRSTDNAGNTAAIYSNGQTVAPSLTFAVSPASISFADLGVGNSYSDSKYTTLTTSTNAYNGYVIRAYITDLLRSTLYPTKTIINFDGGTYASPGSWGAGNYGFGYTSSDTTIQGSNKFSGGTLYAPFSQIGPGDILADHTSNVTGTPITDEAFTITNKVKSDGAQAAGPYATTVIYTINAQY